MSHPLRSALVAAFAVLMHVNAAVVYAQPRTTRGSSILFLPLVVTSPTDDTRLELTNLSNGAVVVRCFYLDGALLDPDVPEGPENPRLCTELDFGLDLLRQRTVSWLVSEGKDTPSFRIPPVGPDFQGALTCVETDSSGAPVGGNHLYASARLIRGGDIARYGAIGLWGTEQAGETGNTLSLGQDQYAGCPALWRLDHFADEAESPSLGAGSSVRTELAIFPCSMNYETQEPPSFSVEIVATNEFEQQFAAQAQVSCWFESLLSDIDAALSVDVLGSAGIQTTLTPGGAEPSGFVVVGREIHESSTGLAASAAVSGHAQGVRAEADVLQLPERQLQLPE